MSTISYALITGASSGIGRAIAEEMGRLGYPLLLVSHQPHELEQTAEALKYKGFTCRVKCADLSQPGSAAELYQYCTDEQMQVDILVNNAGILLFGEVTDLSPSQVSAILQLHMHTPAMLCRYFLPQMYSKKKGHILNVSSISAVMPYPYISLYGPTKTFIRMFSRALRQEAVRHGVNVSCLIPGATATGMYDPNRVNLEQGLQYGVMHTSAYVAKKAVRGMMTGSAEIVPGFRNKLLVYVLPSMPEWLVQWMIRKTTWPEKLRQMLQPVLGDSPK